LTGKLFIREGANINKAPNEQLWKPSLDRGVFMLVIMVLPFLLFLGLSRSQDAYSVRVLGVELNSAE